MRSPRSIMEGSSFICCIKDGENVLLKTEMLASSRLQAESMRDCFLRRPEELYKAVLHSLTGEDF